MKLPVHYGWIVVALAFTTTLVVAGVRSAPAVFIVPLEAEFGWNRAEIASAISLNLLMFGMAAPLSGWLIDRYGPRTVMLGGVLMLGLGISGTLMLQSLWQLVLFWGILVGLGAGASGSVLSATIATRWFVARRGLVLGLLSSGTSTGQLIFIPQLMLIVVTMGWRAGSAFLACACAVMLLPILLWMRNDPAAIGAQPFGAGGSESAAARQADAAPRIGIREAARTREFWLLALSFFACGATTNGLVGTHLIPHSIDHGIPEVTAAATVGVMGGMNFIGTLLSGYLTDRVDPRKLLACYYVFRGLSLFALPFVTDFAGLMIFAVVYGLDWFATVPATVAITANRFGRRSIGSIYGWIFLSHQIGSAMAAVSAGAIRVWLGDYQMAFIAGGCIALVGAGMALLVRTPSRAPLVDVSRAAAA
ncbi:MAG: Permease of the major facilitator superfamily [Chloroflexi bacterium]|nr:Permease of the major facilitator superfamily [Chloroflexota bacterium]